MKKYFILVLLLFYIFTHKIYAHGSGLPPYFTVNGKDTLANPLQTYGITAQGFVLPQDIAPAHYIIDEPINFVIDKTQLETVVAKELLETAVYSWDFGDGTKGEGLQNTHIYKKIGSYILLLTISVYTPESETPIQFTDSFLLQIVPTKQFENFPKAIIILNGKKVSSNPLEDVEKVNFTTPIVFDATSSQSHSSKLVTYFWNFGDGQTSTKSITTHTYKEDYFRTVILRVKDENGYFSDAFVGLKHDPYIQNTLPASEQSRKNAGKYIIAVIVSVAIVGFFIYKKRHHVSNK